MYTHSRSDGRSADLHWRQTHPPLLEKAAAATLRFSGHSPFSLVYWKTTSFQRMSPLYMFKKFTKVVVPKKRKKKRNGFILCCYSEETYSTTLLAVSRIIFA